MFNRYFKKRWFILLLLTIIGIAIYFNSLRNGFHFDDWHHIVNNPYLRDLGFIPSYFTDTSTFSINVAHHGHYRPLLLVTHAINYYLGGLNPVGYHLVNLGFHIGAAFLVYLIVREMVENGRSKKEEVRNLTSYLLPLASGLIFLVHPFNSEVVNYISARSSVMSGFFYLLAFYCWIRFRQVEGRRLQVEGKDEEVNLLPSTFYMFSLLAFLLGMLTKEILITLPVVLWLYDLYFYRPQSLTQHMRRLKVYLPFIFLVAIPYIILRTYLVGNFLSRGSLARGFYENLLTQSKVLIKSIYLLIFPVGLTVEHDIKVASSIFDYKVLLSVIVLTIIVVAGLCLARSRHVEWKIVSFFIWWFFVTSSLTTIIPLNAILQENRFYLASLSFAILLAIVANRGISFVVLNRQSVLPVKIILLFFFIPILLFYSVLTIKRNTVWQDEITLWQDAVQKMPASARALSNLAYGYSSEGMIELAIQLYERAIKLDPHFSAAYYNLGELYRYSGRIDEAIKAYKTTIKINPRYYSAYNNLALLELKRGYADIAIELFKRSLRIKPDNVKTHMGLAAAYLKAGKDELAAGKFEDTARLALSLPGFEKEAEDAMEMAMKLRKKIKESR